MTQLQKYTWLIDTIRRSGRISLKDLSDKWERNKDLSDCKPLHRATFNRWRDDIFSQFGIMIECQKVGGYLYYIENPEDIDEDELKKWMLDSFAVGNLIGENLDLKDRILVDQIPSGRDFLTEILTAMKENRVVEMSYKPFKKKSATFQVYPYCVKLFQNRWYMLASNPTFGDKRIYGLDRIEAVKILDETFKLPKDFSAPEFFAPYFGVVSDGTNVERVIIRADKNHKHYMQSLPIHHSQRLLADEGEYADFELMVAPTYDFIMKLLHTGAMIEVLQPASLRRTMKGWISEMFEIYKND